MYKYWYAKKHEFIISLTYNFKISSKRSYYPLATHMYFRLGYIFIEIIEWKKNNVISIS